MAGALSYAEGAVVLSEALREDDFVQQYTSALIPCFAFGFEVESYAMRPPNYRQGKTIEPNRAFC